MKNHSSNKFTGRCTKISFIVIFTVFLHFAGKSAIFTVDNNYPTIGDYTTLQEAHDAASNGDTIYVFPSMVGYVGIDIEKKLAIIGAGFGNYELSNSTSSLIGKITFKSNSIGSILEGFGGRFQLEIFASDITIRRNFIKTMTVFSDVTGIVIIQNQFAKYGGESGISILFDKNTSGIILNNKFHNWGNVGVFAGNSHTSVVIQNNIMDIYSEYAIDVSNVNHLIRNNIFTDNSTCKDSIAFSCTHNIASRAGLPSNSTNYINVDLATIFVNQINWEDLNIIQGSIADGTGYGGVNMGIYGGDTPFIDGGYPSIPSIYHLDVPLNANQKEGLNITIKAKSNP
jgi:hypothetical protein